MKKLFICNLVQGRVIAKTLIIQASSFEEAEQCFKMNLLPKQKGAINIREYEPPEDEE